MVSDRKFPRLNFSCNIDFKPYGNLPIPLAEELQSITTTKDISSGGICFITYQAFPIGTTLQFTFKLSSDEKPIKALGRIIWRKKFTIGDTNGWDNGIEFVDLSDDYKAKIDQFIQANSLE